MSRLPSAASGISRSSSRTAGHPAAGSATTSRCTARPVRTVASAGRVELAPNSTSWGIRRRVPSASGAAFRKPEEAAALSSWTRLQRTPAAGAPRHHTGRWRARETDRPERAGTVDGPVEGEGIAGHERAPRERGGERRVPGRQGRRPAGRHRRRPAGPGAHLTRRIGLREEHVEPDGDRPQAPDPVQEGGDPVAGPRPAPRLGQGPLVDLDDVTRPDGGRTEDLGKEPIVDREVERTGVGAQEVEHDTGTEPQVRRKESEGRRPRPAPAPRIIAPSYPSPREIDPAPRSRYGGRHHGRERDRPTLGG